MKHYKLIISILILLSSESVSQSLVIDSLEKTINTSIPDTQKVLNWFKIFAESAKLGNQAKEKEAAEKSLRLAEEISYQFGIAKALSAMGLYYYHVSDFEKAIDFNNKSLKKSIEIGDYKIQGNVISNLANVYLHKSDYGNAIKIHNQGLELRKKLKDNNGIAISLMNLGIVYHKLNEYSTALDYYLQALVIQRQLNEKVGINRSVQNIGSIYFELNDYEKAMEYHRKSFETAIADNDKKGEALASTAIGNIHFRKSNLDSALHYQQNSLAIWEVANDKIYIGAQFKFLGNIYGRKKNIEKAKEYYLKAISLHREINDKNNLVETLISTSEWLNDIREFNSSLVYALEAYDLSIEINSKGQQKRAADCLSIIYENTNNFADALKYKKFSQSLNDSIYSISSLIEINKLKTKAALDQQQFELTTLANEEKLRFEAIAKREKEIANLKLKQQKQIITLNKVQSEKNQAELLLLSRENDIKNFEVTQKSLALSNQKKENEKTQQQLTLSQKETELKNAQLSAASLKQKFAVAGIVALIVFGGYTFYLFKKRKKLSNRLASSLTDLKQTQNLLIQLEKEKEAEAIRLRISRDIHDDIGSNLTKIAMLGNLASAQSKHKMPEMTEQLEKISSYARMVNTSMSEIIWAVNPKQDTLENLLAYMRVHTEEFLKESGINQTINFPLSIPDIQLNPDLKRSLFLVLKESLNNAVKHAEAKNILVSFKTFEGLKNPKVSFELQIADDGKGFNAADTKITKSGNGLSNLEARMQHDGSTFSIQSTPGHGCNVVVKGVM